MCMRTVDVVINMYTIVSQLINMKGKVMRHFHLYEDINAVYTRIITRDIRLHGD